MKAISILIQSVLIATIGISIAMIVLPWTYTSVSSSMDISEIQSVKADMLKCSDKILETARTGSTNKCFISVSKGELEVKKDGIYYTMTSNDKICDKHEWTLIEENKQLWQKCIAGSTYQLRWFYPKNDVILLEGEIEITSVSGTKNYNLYPKGLLFINFDSPKKLTGKNIEITRDSISNNTTVLKINIY